MPTSDQIVTAKIVLQSQLEVQRIGIQQASSLLESAEPDLTEYILETTTRLYHDLLHVGIKGKQARRIHNDIMILLLVTVRSLQNAHAALWQQQTGEEIAAKLEPPTPPETAAS
ncbi:MAG: hypothetical protein FWD61_02125 [Phycisphaerales bacterium]|nr:hypothetical protein [Phycisphaerales bacterium]